MNLFVLQCNNCVIRSVQITMGSKIIAITGLVVSAAFVYFCVDMKKDTIAVKCDIKKQIGRMTGDDAEITDEKIVEVTPSQNGEGDNNTVESSTPPAMYEKSDPAFGIMLGEQINIVGMFEPKAKEGVLANYIDEICNNTVCINDVRYSDDIKHVTWDGEIVKLIQFMQEEKIEGGSLYINSNVLHIEGKIVTPQQKRRLAELEQEIKKAGLAIEDKTVYKTSSATEKVPTVLEKTELPHAVEEVEKVTQKEHIPTIEKVETSKEAVEKSVTAEGKKKAEIRQKMPVSKVSNEATGNAGSDETTIEQTLKQHPITFISNNNQLSIESQKVLDKVVEKLKRSPEKKVLIKVCTHIGDDHMVNMIVAQKRATLIQRYLWQKGIKKSITQGSACDAGEEQVTIEPVE